MWVAQVYSYLGKSTKSCIFLVFHTSWMAHALFHHHLILVCSSAAPERVFPPSPFPQPFIPGFVPSPTCAHMLLPHRERLKWMNSAHTTVFSLHQSPCWGDNTEDCPGMKMQPGNGIKLVAGETTGIIFSVTMLTKLWNNILWNVTLSLEY